MKGDADDVPHPPFAIQADPVDARRHSEQGARHGPSATRGTSLSILWTITVILRKAPALDAGGLH